MRAFSHSDVNEDVDETTKVANNLVGAEPGLAKDTIDESNGDLLDGVAHVLSASNDLHLEAIAASFNLRHDGLNDFTLVKTERTGQVTGSRAQSDLGHQVGNTRSQLAIEVPTKDSATRLVPSARDYITVGFFLLLNKLLDEFRL